MAGIDVDSLAANVVLMVASALAFGMFFCGLSQ